MGEHTDYGLLTSWVKMDPEGSRCGRRRGWVDAPPRPGSIVCNLGDMLERLTGGRYRLHPPPGPQCGRTDRLSFPFFLDPSWDATVDRLPIVERPADDDGAERWDHVSVHGFKAHTGTTSCRRWGRSFPTSPPETITRS